MLLRTVEDTLETKNEFFLKEHQPGMTSLSHNTSTIKNSLKTNKFFFLSDTFASNFYIFSQTSYIFMLLAPAIPSTLKIFVNNNVFATTDSIILSKLMCSHNYNQIICILL